MHIKKCVGLTAYERVTTLKFALTFSKFDNLRNFSSLEIKPRVTINCPCAVLTGGAAGNFCIYDEIAVEYDFQ